MLERVTRAGGLRDKVTELLVKEWQEKHKKSAA